MTDGNGSAPARRVAWWATWVVIAIHAALLVAMLPDYFADNDLGFHISLGRQYAEHGTYFWDHLNWAPSGRPNLQGPLLHIAIGALGRLLGGQGDDYVLAFSLLAVLQWAAAAFTAAFFARRFGGDLAGLLAAALFTGAVWSAGSFFVGVPSGWIFILTPWAIHSFLRERYLLSALFTTAVMYVHLGGAPVAPFGVFLSALFTRRWKGLIVVGALTALLTSPYLIHFYRHLDWYTGRRGFVAGDYARLTYLLAAAGLVWMLRRPKENLFLLIWAAAPLAWVFQDALRFMLQSTVAASAIAGVFVASLINRIGRRGIRATVAAGIVLVAQVYPFSVPALPVELAWAAGKGFPRELDWKEARVLAQVLEDAGLSGRIVHSYYDSLSAAISVYVPLSQEYGHWGEVRPKVNPARDVSAGEKAYVLPVPPHDAVLRRFEEAGWVTVHGGGAETTVATLPRLGPLQEVAAAAAHVIQQEAEWLATNGVNNRMPPAEDLVHADRIRKMQRTRALQKAHAGRIETAFLVYAFALEPVDARAARDTRAAVRSWGSVANFIGDETAMDYLSDERFEQFRANLLEVAAWAPALRESRLPGPEQVASLTKLFEEFFGQRGEGRFRMAR